MESTCRFLKNVSEIKEATKWLGEHGYVSHSLECKNWDLFHVLSDISYGEYNVVDLGCVGSYILSNCKQLTTGRLVGVDVRRPKVWNVGEFVKGSVVNTGLKGGGFQVATCISVIEHGVPFVPFLKEAKRLLSNGGVLYVSFDYWKDKIHTKYRPYKMPWNILSREDVEKFVVAAKEHGLVCGEIDWSVCEPVITSDNWGPKKARNVKYTVGFLRLCKV